MPKWKKRGERKAPLEMTPLVLSALAYGAKCEEMGRLKVMAVTKKERKLWVAYYAAKAEAGRLLEVLASNYVRRE